MGDSNSKFSKPPQWEDLPENTRRYIWWNVSFSKHLPKIYIALVILMLALVGLMLLVRSDGADEIEHRSLQNSRASGIDKVAHQLRMFNIKMGKYPETLEELVPSYLKSLPADIKGNAINYLYARSVDDKRFHVGVVLQGYDGGIIFGPNMPHPLTYDSDFNSMTANYLNGFDGADPVYDLEESR